MEEWKQEVESLKSSLTGDLFQDMETRDKIHNLEMKINGVKPSSSEFECVGCGSWSFRTAHGATGKMDARSFRRSFLFSPQSATYEQETSPSLLLDLLV